MELLQIEDLASSAEWWELWDRDTYQHPWYLPDQLAVSATHRPSLYHLPPQLRPRVEPHAEREFLPRGLLARDREGPVLGLTLSVERIADTVHLSAFGRPLCPVEDACASGPRRKSAAHLVLRRLEELRQECRADAYHIRDLLVGGELSCLSESVLRAGGTARPFFTQMIDLTLPIERLRKDLRDSLRNLVRRERPGYEVELVTAEGVTSSHTDALRRLHLLQHGREFRAAGSWQPLEDNVRSGSAFFVFGLIEGEYVSGAYFPYSRRYCHYSIAANDPARYGSGLSHLLLWRAIEHSRRLGCEHFEVGDRIYPGQHDHVDPKFHAISHFKAGFSSHVAIRLDISAPT